VVVEYGGCGQPGGCFHETRSLYIAAIAGFVAGGMCAGLVLLNPPFSCLLAPYVSAGILWPPLMAVASLLAWVIVTGSVRERSRELASVGPEGTRKLTTAIHVSGCIVGLGIVSPASTHVRALCVLALMLYGLAHYLAHTFDE